MASREVVAQGLYALYEAYPTREVTDNTARVWHTVFATVDDAAFERGCAMLLTEAGRKFFPTPGELHAAILGPPPAIDVPGLVRRIEAMGSYNARTGWIWPRVDEVREALGEGVAAAYGMVGSRLGADDETTRSIALRDFSSEAAAQVARDPRALLPPAPLPALESGEPTEDVDVKKIVDDVAKKLDAKKESDDEPK